MGSSPLPPEFKKILGGDEVDELIELYVVSSDLKAAKDTLSLYCEKYVFRDLEVENEKTISTSLFRDGILLFCSCFSSRDPLKLNPTIYASEEGGADFFKKLHDLRDSFVAHNFGSQRMFEIVVVCHEFDGEFQPTAFTEIYSRLGGWSREEAERIIKFIDIAMAAMNERIDTAVQTVRQKLQTMTSDQLKMLRDAQIVSPTSDDLRISRKRFRMEGRGERTDFSEERWIQTPIQMSPGSLVEFRKSKN